ncbi:hypothetical protein SADUNF_Sadunf14G0107500 [Salix dunnii]|uniref:Uncharacterized protein n=1 Tax=Salix dunnii TaxID=1413687 RepID=A0A835JDY9_9ROSI|nr:hypothetical protein SADUNF_Sadunf14G0107500 [Salix dunnii]
MASYTFELLLVRHDIQQESDRHTYVLDAITNHPSIGSCREWSEEHGPEWLLTVLKLPPGIVGAYMISMATNPSDILTLADLEAAPDAVARLFSINWYRNLIKGKREVTIGYSDSGKDAGCLSAAWQLRDSWERRRAYPSCYITQPPDTIRASLRLFVIQGTAPFPGKEEKKSNLAQKAPQA